jgi:hypothetical protein
MAKQNRATQAVITILGAATLGLGVAATLESLDASARPTIELLSPIARMILELFLSQVSVAFQTHLVALFPASSCAVELLGSFFSLVRLLVGAA